MQVHFFSPHLFYRLFKDDFNFMIQERWRLWEAPPISRLRDVVIPSVLKAGSGWESHNWADPVLPPAWVGSRTRHVPWVFFDSVGLKITYFKLGSFLYATFQRGWPEMLHFQVTIWKYNKPGADRTATWQCAFHKRCTAAWLNHKSAALMVCSHPLLPYIQIKVS